MKKLILAVMLSVLLLGFGTAYAATCSVDNVPGGAGYNYFHASAAGDVTLFNVQNVENFAIMVHIVIYDQDSNEVVDFNVPLSGWDNWGCSITGDGTNITVTPQGCPSFFGPTPADGCFAPIVRALPAGADGIQRGYMGFVISAMDIATWVDPIAGLVEVYGGNGDGDPRNDPIITGISMEFPDIIFGRTALLNPTAGSAIAINSSMLQGFVNVFTPGTPGIDEGVSLGTDGGWDSIFDVPVTYFYNCDGDTLDAFPSTDDPGQGLKIDSWEIMITDFIGWNLVTDDTNADGIGDTIYNAVGSASGTYWGRYNENPAIPSNTWLITVFPANSGTAPIPHSPPCGYVSRNMSVFCYDDNEFPQSTPITSPEVGRIIFDPAGIAVPAISGECRIVVDAPLLGFTYTEAGNYADLYPLVHTDKWIEIEDGMLFTGHLPDPIITEVNEIGQQVTY